MLVVLVIAGTLLLCWLVDKGFEKWYNRIVLSGQNA